MPIITKAIPSSPLAKTPSKGKVKSAPSGPSRFRLAFDVGRVPKGRSADIRSYRPELEFDVRKLLTTAPLRHSGSPYGKTKAIEKETALWNGWVGVHAKGPLRGRLFVRANTGNAGRLTEFSASLGETVALAFFVDILRIPLAKISRIPETNPTNEGMDFKTTSVPGGIAIEGKSGHGSCLKGKKRAITKQFRRQKGAVEKYGVVVSYQMQGRPALKILGSSVHVYDPRGQDAELVPDETAILFHYLEVCEAIGFWSIVDGLRFRLGLPAREHANFQLFERLVAALARSDFKTSPQATKRSWINPYGPGFAFARHDELYFCRAFDVALAFPRSTRPPVVPYVVCGLALSVIESLVAYAADPSEERRAALMEVTCGPERHARFDFSLERQGRIGTIYYAGLEDGTCRLDLTERRQLAHEAFDIAG